MTMNFDAGKGKFEGNLVETVKGLFPEKDPKKVVEEVKFAKFVEVSGRLTAGGVQDQGEACPRPGD